MTTMLLTLTLTGLLGAPWMQDAERDDDRSGSGLPLASELRMEVYRPEHARAGDLMLALQHMIGDSLVVFDAEHKRPHEARNLQMLGEDRLLLYDLPAALERHLQVLRKLDAPVEGAAQPMAKRELRSYRPRYVSLSTAHEALRPFDGRYSTGPLEIHTVEDQGLLALRGRAPELEEALAYLAQVDVQRPQVTIVCRLIAPSEEPEVPVEKRISDELERLTLMSPFEERGFAILRSSIDLGSRRSVRLDDRTNRTTFELTLEPTAYDPQTGDVTFRECALVRHSPGGTTERLFQTALTVGNAEPTVVGATGLEPMFVLLRCTTDRAD